MSGYENVRQQDSKESDAWGEKDLFGFVERLIAES